MGYDFELNGQIYRVTPAHGLGRPKLRIADRTFAADLFPGLDSGEFLLEIDGRQERVFVATRGDVQFIHYRGRTHRIEAVNALERARRDADSMAGFESLRAPMPGTVVEVAVSEGDVVESGQRLLTIESMKLQTALTAEAPARVTGIHVTAGATFDQGETLIQLEALEDETAAGGKSE